MSPFTRGRIIGLLLAAWLVPAAGAAVIVNDTFTDGGRTNGADLLDADWYFVAPNLNDGTVAVVDDSAGIGSGNALKLERGAGTGGAFMRGVGKFAASPVTLLTNTGDVAKLTVDLRLTVFGDATGGGFRLGLDNSNGTEQVADQGNNAANNAANDFGYGIRLGTNGTVNADLIYETGSDGVLSGSDVNVFEVAGTGITISNTLRRTAILTLTKTVGGVNVAAEVFDAAMVSLVSWADDAPVTYTAFDEIVFGNGFDGGLNKGNVILVDNVKLETIPFAVVPEPATLGMGLLAAVGFLSRRRR